MQYETIPRTRKPFLTPPPYLPRFLVPSTVTVSSLQLLHHCSLHLASNSPDTWSHWSNITLPRSLALISTYYDKLSPSSDPALWSQGALLHLEQLLAPNRYSTNTYYMNEKGCRPTLQYKCLHCVWTHTERWKIRLPDKISSLYMKTVELKFLYWTSWCSLCTSINYLKCIIFSVFYLH